MHPKPKLGAFGDATGDHIIDPRRQRYRFPFVLCQSVNTDRLLEYETMPQTVRNAKNEHNR